MDLQKAIKTIVLQAFKVDVRKQLEMNVEQQFKMNVRQNSDNSVKLNDTAITMKTDGNNNEGESAVNSRVIDLQIACESNPLTEMEVKQQLEMNVQQQFKMNVEQDSDNSVKLNLLNDTVITMKTDGNNDEGESTMNSRVIDPQNACESNPLAEMEVQQLEMNVQQQFKMDVEQDSDKSEKMNLLNDTVITMETDSNNGEGESTMNSRVIDPQNACETNPLAPKKKPENAMLNDKAAEKIPTVTKFMLACDIWSIFSYFIFMTGNIRLIIEYSTSDKNEHLIFMIVLVILTSAAIVGVGAKMQYYDVEIPTTEGENNTKKRRWLDVLSNLKVPFWLAALFQLDVLLRSVRRLCHGLSVRKCEAKGDLVQQAARYDARLKDNANLARLNMIRSFLASAPQLMLKLTIYFDQGSDSVPVGKMVFWCITTICLGWAMKTYHCAVRLSQSDKRRITKLGEVFLLLWYACTIGARILIIAIAASKGPSYTLLGCTVNWIGWTTWIYVQKNGVLDFCRDRRKSEPIEPTRLELFLFSAVIAVVYTCTPVILKDEPTRITYSVYYVLTILQNVAMLLLFIYFGSPPVGNILILYASCILAVILFLIGITAMMIYYLFLQPTLNARYPTLSPV